jgi:serine/threonine protein kinase
MDQEATPGQLVGRYVILNRLGAGGMGVVYAAYDPELDRKVALKLIRQAVRDDGSARELQDRLVREAQAMARIAHPNVTAVHDVGRHADQVYAAMELVNGETLAAWLARAPRPASEIVRVFRQAGEGLQAAHAAGLVHRDFKLNNVMIDGAGRARVMDFGLARLTGLRDGTEPASPQSRLDASLTASGMLLGTPAYMAPEQLAGEAADARSDQFSFCVALYEALYSMHPFTSTTLHERLAEINAGQLRSPRTASVPRHILHALQRGLAADPQARFATMNALLDALSSRRWRLAWLALPLTAMLALGTTALLRARPSASQPQVMVHSMRRLTFARGCENWPSFTPDGRTLVYNYDGDGDDQLYALDLDSGKTRQLTHAPGDNSFAKVSPDGRRIAYFHDSDGPRRLSIMPLDGSAAPRTIAPVPVGVVTWRSPSLVAVLDSVSGVVTWDVDDSKAQPSVVERSWQGRPIALISAFKDGALAVTWREADPFRASVGVFAPDGVHLLGQHIPNEQRYVLAAPSQQAVYFSRHNGAVNELVRVPRGGGPLEAVGGGVVTGGGVSISADGKKLAFSTCHDEEHLVQFDAAGAPVPLSPYVAWNQQHPAVLDEHRILFTSSASGEPEISVLDLSTREVRSLGEGQMAELSHDRRWVAYSMHKQGGIWLRLFDESQPPRRLTDNQRDSSPRFSHDDQNIVFERSSDDHQPSLWIVPVAGGAARQLVAAPAFEPMPSAADDRIFYVEHPGTSERLMFIREHGDPRPARASLPPTGRSWHLSRSRDGRRILIAHDLYEIMELDVDRDRPPVVKHRLKNGCRDVSYAADDEHVIAAMSFGEGDLWLAEGRFP